MTAPSLEIEQHGPVLLVRMVREHKRNAIDHAMAKALDAAFNHLEDGPGLRAGVLTGTSTVFSAGTDMYDPHNKRTTRGGEYGLIRRTRRRPLIAAVEGPAVGGGFEIALSCDLVVAGRSAGFALPETRRGLVATSGALFRGPRALPRNIATELLLTGSTLGADRAYQLGLVNQVVPDGTAVDAGLELAAQICESSPVAVAETLAALADLVRADDATGWAVTENARAAALASPDADEGRLAFAERRSPQWVHQ